MLDDARVGFVAELCLNGCELGVRFSDGRLIELKLVKVAREFSDEANKVSVVLCAISNELVLLRLCARLLHGRVDRRPDVCCVMHDVVRVPF